MIIHNHINQCFFLFLSNKIFNLLIYFNLYNSEKFFSHEHTSSYFLFHVKGIDNKFYCFRYKNRNEQKFFTILLIA